LGPPLTCYDLTAGTDQHPLKRKIDGWRGRSKKRANANRRDYAASALAAVWVELLDNARNVVWQADDAKRWDSCSGPNLPGHRLLQEAACVP